MTEGKYLGSRQELGKVTNKCQKCGVRYKLPQSVFEPRDKICFTCEVNEEAKAAFKAVGKAMFG